MMKDTILKIFYKILWALAHRYLKKRKPIIIGINGSVWKTSCRMIITDIIKKYLPHDVIYTSPKNFNGELGMSLAIFKIESWGGNFSAMITVLIKTIWLTFFSRIKPYDVTILEYGIDTPGEMTFLLSIVKPHISVLTKIDAVHSLQFGNPEEIAKEETKLQQWTLETCIINHDDSYGRSLENMVDVDILRYNTQETDTHDTTLRYNNYTLSIANDTWHAIQSNSDITIGKKHLHITTNILWKNNHGYIAVWLAVTDIISHKLHGRDITPSHWDLFIDLHLQSWRMSVFKGIHESILIDSSYNASPLSVQSAINDTHRIQQTLLPNYKVILVIGDMRELGEWTEKHHRELAWYLSQYGDTLFLLGESTGKYTLDELQKIGYEMSHVQHFMHYDKLWVALKQFIEKHTHEKYLVLFKWSQNTIFLEESIKHILFNKEDIVRLTRQGSWWASKKHVATEE